MRVPGGGGGVWSLQKREFSRGPWVHVADFGTGFDSCAGMPTIGLVKIGENALALTTGASCLEPVTADALGSRHFQKNTHIIRQPCPNRGGGGDWPRSSGICGPRASLAAS